MKLFTTSVISGALVVMMTAANAQSPASPEPGRLGSVGVSASSGPYGPLPPDVSEPAYGRLRPGYGPAVGYGPALPYAALLPPGEIYVILRESGFRPLGPVRQRGMFYVLAAIDRYGEDGRLVVDARTGRIVRFLPAYGMGVGPYGAAAMPYPPPGRLPPVTEFGEPPRPPAAVPKVASRTAAVPIPKAAPSRPPEDGTLAEKPALQSQQSAAVQLKPAAPATGQGAAAAPPEVKAAAPEIRPTQPMPQVQGLE